MKSFALRHSPLPFVLLCLLLCRFARAVPGYDAQPVTGLPNLVVGVSRLSQFNNDGAFAYSYHDDTAPATITGIWVPRPLYGRAAGFTPLFTFPGAVGVTGVWPMIDNAGNVTYITVDGSGGGGGIYGSSSGPISPESLPNWNDVNALGLGSFAFRGLSGWATSDPAPFAGFAATVTIHDGNIFQPYFSYDYSGSLNGGLQIMARPAGDFGSLDVLNQLGHQIWSVQDVRADLPGRVRGQTSRFYAVTPVGTMEIAEGYFMSGRGDVKFSTSTPAPAGLSPGTNYILLAGPLGPLGPGLHRQADIPGMPAGGYITKFNSSGTILAGIQGQGFLPVIVNGGKSVPLGGLLPPVVPRPRPLNFNNVSYINEAGMLAYVAYGNDGTGPLFLLTPTLDCEVALTGTQPYRVGGEFDLDVTVRNVAGAAVTNVRVEGDTPGSPGISVATDPSFDIIGGPVPPTPLTLAPGATQVIRYRCRATRSGIGEVTAKVKGTAASTNALVTQATTPIEIELRGDLLVKRTDEPPASFALDNVYQKTAPEGTQNRRELITAEGEVLSFDVKIQNDESGPLTLRVASLETGSGSTSIPVHYFQGTTDITAIITAGGWITPELAAGANVTLRVDFGPTEGAISGDVRAARLTLRGENGGGPCDLVRMEAVNAPPIEFALRRPAKEGLHPQSILAGKGDINAPLAFNTDTAALHILAEIKKGLVADGVTPLLVEMRVPPEDLAGLPDGVTYNMALEIAAGGTLGGTPPGERLSLLKDGRWQRVSQVTFTESQNVHFATITPVRSDDLQLTGGARELRLRLRFRQPGSDAIVTDKLVPVRRPPIALVHGYNTNGDWGDGFVNTLGLSRGQDFVKTIRYGQWPPTAPDVQREATVLSFQHLVPALEGELELMRALILDDGWAMTRYDVVAHSQGGVLTRMLCSQNTNSFLDQPFRHPDNFFRGRFHRVITVGSPHNGTRIVSYMNRAFNNISLSPAHLRLGIVDAISAYMILSGNSQSKFDPFSADILRLNNPHPTGPWYPDPGAMFHLVQTTVNHGAPPSTGSGSSSELFLGLASPLGSLVIPRGSDGVVDFDSMTATTPEAGQSPPPNSYRIPPVLQISHAHIVKVVEGLPIALFGGTEGQVGSLEVATHVIGALDQLSAIPPGQRVFGSFRLAITLPQSVADSIQAAADQVDLNVPDVINFVAGPSPRDVVSRLCEFTLPPGEVLAGPVTWTAERYGENGLSDEGVTLLPSGNPARIGVQIDRRYWGDVVLYGTAVTASGRVIIGAPFVVESTVPDSATWDLDSLEVEPAGGSYPEGAGIEPVLYETWVSPPDAEGSVTTVRMRRYPRPENMTVSAVPSYVMDVTDPLLWTATQPGGVEVTVTVNGVEARMQYTIYPLTTNGVDEDGDGRSDSDEAAVPNLTGPGTGDSDGDGFLDKIEGHVTPLRGPSGKWFTIATGDAFYPLLGVTPQSPPADPALLPEVSAFDFGFVSFNVWAPAPGGSIIVTMLLPANHEVTSLWAYGPEPGLTEPHWFEFLDDGLSGGVIEPDRIVLHLTDGGPGDADGEANGYITLVPFGPARFIPAPPALEFLSGSQLTWPEVFPNRARTILETSDDLDIWHFLPDSPQAAAGQNTLPIPPGPRGYFRLRGF